MWHDSAVARVLFHRGLFMWHHFAIARVIFHGDFFHSCCVSMYLFLIIDKIPAEVLVRACLARVFFLVNSRNHFLRFLVMVFVLDVVQKGLVLTQAAESQFDLDKEPKKFEFVVADIQEIRPIVRVSNVNTAMYRSLLINKPNIVSRSY